MNSNIVGNIEVNCSLSFLPYMLSAWRIFCSLIIFPFQINIKYWVAQLTAYSYLRKNVWFSVCLFVYLVGFSLFICFVFCFCSLSAGGPQLRVCTSWETEIPTIIETELLMTLTKCSDYSRHCYAPYSHPAVSDLEGDKGFKFEEAHSPVTAGRISKHCWILEPQFCTSDTECRTTRYQAVGCLAS